MCSELLELGKTLCLLSSEGSKQTRALCTGITASSTLGGTCKSTETAQGIGKSLCQTGVAAQGRRETVLHMKALKGEGHQRSRFSQPAWRDVCAWDQLD